jgi:hypothetical protein
MNALLFNRQCVVYFVEVLLKQCIDIENDSIVFPPSMV